MTGFSSLFARTQGGGGLGANVGFVSLLGRGVGGSGLVSGLSLLTFNVSDTASISVTESPVDSQEIATGDIARLSVTDVAQLFNNVGLSDTASLSLSESISLVIAGVTLKTASDTTSITLSAETAALSITLAVTDTASLTLSAEDATVDVSVEQVVVSDTVSISVDDASLRNIFAGFNNVSASDAVSLLLNDVATVVRRDFTVTTPNSRTVFVRNRRRH